MQITTGCRLFLALFFIVMLGAVQGCKLRPAAPKGQAAYQEKQPSNDDGKQTTPGDESAKKNVINAPNFTNGRVGFHGLSNVNLDVWTAGFYLKTVFEAIQCPGPGGSLVSRLESELKGIYDAELAFAKILKLQLNRDHKQITCYYQTVDALYAMRKRIRQSVERSLFSRRQLMLLLEVLAEETLFVAAIKFPNKVKPYKTVWLQSDEKNCFAARSSRIDGIALCQGDVVISKGGAGSSSFIARMTRHPGNYSHAAIAWVDPNSGKLFFPEAFIEDGVKLREATKNYLNPSKKKLAIFRYHPKDSTAAARRTVMTAVSHCVDAFIKRMYKRSSDPINVSAWDYDFAMNGNETSTYFCSEIPLDIYRSCGYEAGINPYARPWGQVDEGLESFFMSYLNLENTEIPTPSDIELNPQWDIVGFKIDPTRLGDDRIDVALIDVLFNLVRSNKSTVDEYFQAFSGIGNKPLTFDQLNKLADLGLIDRALVGKLAGKIPANINLKQLVFFGYMDAVLAPKMREKMRNRLVDGVSGEAVGLSTLRQLMREDVEKELKPLVKVVRELWPKP